MVTGPQIATLAQTIQHLPVSKMKFAALHANIQSHEWVISGGTTQENALSLAESAARYGEETFRVLSACFAVEASNHPTKSSELTDRIVISFGGLLQEMLESFDRTSDEQLAAALSSQREESEHIRRLERKLGDAQFGEGFIKYAKRTRNDFSGIHRKAELLGFKGYPRLQDRLSSVWFNVIERMYPRPDYTPYQQYHGFLDLLYSRCLYEKHKDMDSIDDLLAGIIFDTVAICVIEW